MENRQVCSALLDDLERRGLDTEKVYLFILDGSKALRSAVAKKFGGKELVQRCQKHKRRNIKGYLSERHGREMDHRLCEAYAMDSFDAAKASLDRTVAQLNRLNPSAAKSLQEGLEETLTLHKLGRRKGLRKSLQTTHVIESCLATTRHLTGETRWRDGDMRQRFACTALLEAEETCLPQAGVPKDQRNRRWPNLFAL